MNTQRLTFSNYNEGREKAIEAFGKAVDLGFGATLKVERHEQADGTVDYLRSWPRLLYIVDVDDMPVVTEP